MTMRQRTVRVTIGGLVIHGYRDDEAQSIAAGLEAGLAEHLASVDRIDGSRAESSRSITSTASSSLEGNQLGAQLGKEMGIALVGSSTRGEI